LSKDFNAVWDSETIFRILGSSLIGQLLLSRCAVFTLRDKKLDLQFVRGFRFREEDLHQMETLDLLSLFDPISVPIDCDGMPERLQELCKSNQAHVIFPMVLNDEIRGVILLGEKKTQKPFSQEDYDFITTLGNLALVSEENARMQQEMIQKQRM